ncbi:hypothetical protein JOD54_001103 [Actinokineospora baliensis]|uniref:phage tail tube protein n=1 Tax=Actinokineospora baliensis TaxID=547056 RepID=UPI00195B5AB6|nr:phage tail tube protein [Actinokineospora baliensis]MBM7770899.1 hypothetical protein [Actinokineospora baliensis]
MALDAAISIGAESAYGVSAAGTTDGYEGKADSWKASREPIESQGFRAGRQTLAADRRRVVDMGGEGELEVDMLDSGAGPLLRACWDAMTVSGGAGDAPTTLTFRTATTPASPSVTAQMIRPKVDGGSVAYRHLGAVVTEWELTQELEAPLTLNASFDFQTVTHSSDPAAALPVRYPAASVPYDWTRGAVYLTLPGSPEAPVAVSKWSVKASRGLKTDRRAVRASALKREPKRSEFPEYEGELEVEFDSNTLALYEAFIAGSTLGLRIAYSGVTQAADGTVSRLELRANAIQFSGESPEASLDELTTMSLPFVVLHPLTAGTDALTMTYVEPSGDDPTTPGLDLD